MDERNGFSSDDKANSSKVAVALSIVATALLTIAFFLPYASAVNDYWEALSQLSQNPFGVSNEELADISLFEYVRIYITAAPEGFAAVYVPLTVAPAALGAFALLFAVLRKPVPVVVLSGLTMAATLLLSWDFEDRGVIPSSTYDWGVARYVYLVAGVIAIACAIWMLVLRRQARSA